MNNFDVFEKFPQQLPESDDDTYSENQPDTIQTAIIRVRHIVEVEDESDIEIFHGQGISMNVTTEEVTVVELNDSNLEAQVAEQSETQNADDQSDPQASAGSANQIVNADEQRENLEENLNDADNTNHLEHTEIEKQPPDNGT